MIKYNLTLVVLILFLQARSPAQDHLQKISAHVYTRQAEKGYFTSIQSNLYFTADGNLVSDFSSPRKYISITNNKGEVQIYDPKENTVVQFQNSLLSTNTTPFYYFFSGKTSDMGLRNAGYKIIDTKFDKNLAITTWQVVAPPKKGDPVYYVKLVHDQYRPVYMDYEDFNRKVIRKVYYYDYTQVGGVEFPKTFTEILYQDKDSIVTKTEYSDFRINEKAQSTLFQFKIPENAKLAKP